MRRLITVLLTATAGMAALAPSVPSAPLMLNYQGVVTDLTDSTIDTTVSMTFALYDDSVGGMTWWTETQPSVTIQNGLFNVLLGSVSPIPDTAFRGHDRYLGITIGGDPELTPRVPLVSVAYSYRVNSVDSARGGAVRGNMTVESSGNLQVVIGGDASEPQLVIKDPGGGARRTMLGAQDTAFAGYDGSGNLVLSGTVTGSSAGVLTAIGPSSDTIEIGNRTGSPQLVIKDPGGGISLATFGGADSLFTGHDSNTDLRISGTIDSDSGAIITFYESGGAKSLAPGQTGRVALILREQSVQLTNPAGASEGVLLSNNGNVDAGGQLTVGPQNGNFGLFSNVLGFQNSVEADFATVSGGTSNTAVGAAATIPGGELNRASGNFSFAAGRRAKADADGCFVWSDPQESDFQTTAPNQFLIRASGGVGINTNAPEPISNGNTVVHIASDADPALVLDQTSPTNPSRWGIFVRGSDGGLSIAQLSTLPIPVETLTFGPNGNIGIGQPDPQNILDVQMGSPTDPVADAWTMHSSRRWKKDIRPIDDPVALVQQLEGVRYRWKATNKEDIGLIAEDVGKVIPEIVDYEENGVDARSVDYARLVALLIEAVKNQQQQIDELKAQIDSQPERKIIGQN